MHRNLKWVCTASKRASEKDIKIYVQCTDIRQGTGHISDEQDRAEFSINQYVYGVLWMSLTVEVFKRLMRYAKSWWKNEIHRHM